MELNDLLKKILEDLTKDSEENYVQVSCLKAEDILKCRTFDADTEALKSKGTVLLDKLKSIKAQMDALNSEFWEYLYSTYSLPREGSYEIKDNKIMKRVKKGDGETARVCICGQCK